MSTDQRPLDLEHRLRSALHTVAATVTDERPAVLPAPVPGPVPASGAGRRRGTRRRVALGIGVVAVPLTLAAGAVVRDGPEYVDRIPPERIVLTGEVGGSRYLLVESDRRDECGQPVTGVELVEEDENLLGSEWNTTGYEYGEYRDTSCGYVNDTSRWREDPSLFGSSGAGVGDSFVWVYAVHPDVTAVRVTAGGDSVDLDVHTVDGAGYAAFEVPEDVTEWTSELLVRDRVDPGRQQRTIAPDAR